MIDIKKLKYNLNEMRDSNVKILRELKRYEELKKNKQEGYDSKRVRELLMLYKRNNAKYIKFYESMISISKSEIIEKFIQILKERGETDFNNEFNIKIVEEYLEKTYQFLEVSTLKNRLKKLKKVQNMLEVEKVSKYQLFGNKISLGDLCEDISLFFREIKPNDKKENNMKRNIQQYQIFFNQRYNEIKKAVENISTYIKENINSNGRNTILIIDVGLIILLLGIGSVILTNIDITSVFGLVSTIAAIIYYYTLPDASPIHFLAKKVNTQYKENALVLDAYTTLSQEITNITSTLD